MTGNRLIPCREGIFAAVAAWLACGLIGSSAMGADSAPVAKAAAAVKEAPAKALTAVKEAPAKAVAKATEVKEAEAPKPKVDAKIAKYAPAKGIEGRIKSVGSDTMNNLMALWGDDFRKVYPSVRIEVEGKGSGTAPPALIEGTADFGPMSRDINPAETQSFTSKFGYKPTQLPAAIDMLAVFVHKDNPIESLTLEQLDAIFSTNRKRGGKEVRTWGDLGLEGDWANKPISLYGRNPASGTYTYFKEHVLEKGDYKATVKQQGGSSGVIQGVATDQYGIGYSGIGYKTSDVRVVPLAKDKKSDPIPAESRYAYDGKYPLSRFLYLSLNYKPKSDLAPLNAEFVKFVFSQEGQQDVIKEGFLPVTSAIATEALKSVGLAGK